MQDYKITAITRDEVVPLAERMHKAGIFLVMIHGFRDREGKMVVSYDYAVDPAIEAYQVIGEESLPSIGDLYDTAATWAERELNELYGVRFEGLDLSQRLFLPEDLLETEGKGQIMVTPLRELVSNMEAKEIGKV